MSQIHSDPSPFRHTEPSQQESAPAGGDKKIIKNPENWDKILEKHLRGDKADVEAYCKKNGIPVGDQQQMLAHSKERMKIGWHRRERKEVSSDKKITDPENQQTQLLVQKIIEDLNKNKEESRKLEGRVKPESKDKT